MSSHTNHPNSHTHGLADGCPRCEEHAQHPLNSLDPENLHALIHRVVTGDNPRSDNEQDAMGKVQEALDQAGRIAQVYPSAFAQYLNRKWRTNFVAVLKEA